MPGPAAASPTRLAVLSAGAPAATSERAVALAAVLKALSDPTRLVMAAMLARESEPLCVCHVEARFALSQPTISHHLKVLREARLVTSERRGVWVYYALDRARVAELPVLAPILAAVELGAPEKSPCCA